jgi:Ca2+-binding EF-hand superfamily protein
MPVSRFLLPAAVLSAAFVLPACPVHAQSFADEDAGTRRADRTERFTALDQDRDGYLSADEWADGHDAFVRLDRNGDGAVSRDEYVEPRALTREEWFKQLDEDRNGRLAFAEWRWSRGSFDQLDLDHDGAVSRVEFLSRGRDRRGESVQDRLRELDRDGDGRISRSEWSGGRFGRLDQNHDGFLSVEELLGS